MTLQSCKIEVTQECTNENGRVSVIFRMVPNNEGSRFRSLSSSQNRLQGKATHCEKHHRLGKVKPGIQVCRESFARIICF